MAPLGGVVEFGDGASARLGHLPRVGDALELEFQPEQVHLVTCLLESRP
jgi:hypothetical protein